MQKNSDNPSDDTSNNPLHGIEALKKSQSRGNVKRRALVSIVAGATLFATAHLADKHNFNDTFYYPIKYRNTPIASGFTREPFELQKEYTLSTDGNLATYFGTDKELYRVKENNHTANKLDDFVYRAKDYIVEILSSGSFFVLGRYF